MCLRFGSDPRADFTGRGRRDRDVRYEAGGEGNLPDTKGRLLSPGCQQHRHRVLRAATEEQAR